MKTLIITDGHQTMLDDDAFEIFKDYKFCISSGYIRMTSPPKTYLHHLIMGVAPEGLVLDHEDRNKLNNQRDNLRFITQQANSYNNNLKKNNTSGYKGVRWHKGARKWMTSLQISGKTIYGGLHETVEAGARAYDSLAKQYNIPTTLNFPNEV